jgi:hypothetical protein
MIEFISKNNWFIVKITLVQAMSFFLYVEKTKKKTQEIINKVLFHQIFTKIKFIYK